MREDPSPSPTMFCLETGSLSAAQASLRMTAILLPQPLGCRGYGRVPAASDPPSLLPSRSALSPFQELPGFYVSSLMKCLCSASLNSVTLPFPRGIQVPRVFRVRVPFRACSWFATILSCHAVRIPPTSRFRFEAPDCFVLVTSRPSSGASMSDRVPLDPSCCVVASWVFS